jgi:hypothetical protein
MSTLEERPTKLPFRAAIEARDHAAVIDAFEPDAVVRSPISAKLVFEGREQIGTLFRAILDVFEDIRYTDELSSGDTAALVLSARVGGEDIEVVEHMRLGPDGKIREFTAFFRPMPAIAVSARVLGTALGRRRSRGRAAAISLLSRPLILVNRAGDGIGARLVRPTFE